MNRSPVKKGDKLKIYTDGASRGNPGPAASAFLFVHNDEIIHDESDFNGTATNNAAEYQAIINALKIAERFSRGHIQVFFDSNHSILTKLILQRYHYFSFWMTFFIVSMGLGNLTQWINFINN